MKVFLVALTLAIATSAALAVEPNVPDVITAYGYHRKVGIPKARFMKQAESRIINGVTTDISEVPYQVGLVIRLLYIFESVCGGSLISPTAVITAAHCDNDGSGIKAQSYTVVLGSNTLFLGGQRITTTDVRVHPQWYPQLATNDIAMLRFDAVTYSNAVQPIALPTGDETSNSYVGKQALASGFGLTSDGGSIGIFQTISSVTLDIVDNSVCVNVYGIATVPSNVCTHNENRASVCSGDSGGPLAVESNGRRVLVGVTSYGHVDGCAIGHPNAFARITSFLDFIEKESA